MAAANNPFTDAKRNTPQSGHSPKDTWKRTDTGHGVRSVLLTGITYLKRKNGGFSYLSAIMDAGTKEILAHVISPSLEIDFVTNGIWRNLLRANTTHM